jgi:hypothetical protein
VLWRVRVEVVVVLRVGLVGLGGELLVCVLLVQLVLLV